METAEFFFDQILDQLCDLNADYVDLNIQFYIKDGFELISDSIIYQSHFNADSAMISHKDPEALNIWVLEDATPSEAGSEGVIVGYYVASPDRDWVVMRRDKMGDGAPFLAHEIGHFFSLLHPHFGWDTDPYDPAKHGVPAPELSPYGNPTERQDGSNCSVAGDLICDTAPDYNNGLGWKDCNYTPIVLDPKGDTIDPDEHLHMSYFFRCLSDRYFSEEQKQLIQEDYMSYRRDYLRTGFPPDNMEISSLPILLEPANGTTTAGSDIAFLEWTSVEGATQYLVEIDRLPIFNTSNFRNYIVTSNSIEITGLEPGQRYFWRVRPFNELFTCTYASNFQSFTTGMLTNTLDIGEISNFSLYPNPMGRKQALQVELVSDRSSEAQVLFYSLAGQLVRKQERVRFRMGKNTYRLPLEGLEPGIYLFLLRSELGVVVEKVVVNY